MIRRRILSQWFEAAVPRVHINGPTMMNCPFMSLPSIRLRYDKRTSSGSMTALGLEVAAPPSSAAEPPLSKIQQAMPSGRSSHRLVLIVCCRIFPTYKCLAVSLSFRHSFYMPGLSHCTVFVSSEMAFCPFRRGSLLWHFIMPSVFGALLQYCLPKRRSGHIKDEAKKFWHNPWQTPSFCG